LQFGGPHEIESRNSDSQMCMIVACTCDGSFCTDEDELKNQRIDSELAVLEHNLFVVSFHPIFFSFLAGIEKHEFCSIWK